MMQRQRQQGVAQLTSSTRISTRHSTHGAFLRETRHTAARQQRVNRQRRKLRNCYQATYLVAELHALAAWR